MADKKVDKKVEDDRASNPGTEPFVPDFEDTGTQGFVPDFEDTGEHSVPFVPNFDDTGAQLIPVAAKTPAKSEATDAAAEAPAVAPEVEPAGLPVQSVTVPGRYQYLKWWKLALVILGVWAATAEVGLSLFYWWFHTIDKTPAVFMALVYVVACTVGGVMLAMVQGRPMISALSIAVMSGPFASVAAAAPLYGYYHCARTAHCLVGIIPY
ncbi:transmembrane protein [Mycobacterium lentiflavum]|uniref:Transmembrane protein n=1 Tax=Mycobacterium lentiflavum TaxID=141349 RepID=A0A0E3WBC4_MYCLN|nr:hypothetical protein [Mycobacterium lentiflavum]MEE3064296.1 hypothetical protein [Actinomycetota bacterium]ULP43113.1 hypothetical protein MJO58_03675 [Mycobacterium lentiflavum]CQD05441.1 transmembrane protein [Mycobacterium lentiflavum]